MILSIIATALLYIVAPLMVIGCVIGAGVVWYAGKQKAKRT